jgi:hypothetical protein
VCVCVCVCVSVCLCCRAIFALSARERRAGKHRDWAVFPLKDGNTDSFASLSATAIEFLVRQHHKTLPGSSAALALFEAGKKMVQKERGSAYLKGLAGRLQVAHLFQSVGINVGNAADRLGRLATAGVRSILIRGVQFVMMMSAGVRCRSRARCRLINSVLV